LEPFLGPVVVCDLRGENLISAEALARLELPPETKRLLFRTSNSDLWAQGVNEFYRDYTALSEDGARWIADHGIGLVGMDYLSIQRYEDSPVTHEILLEAGVVILEGLDLSGVDPGSYELVCLPLLVVGGEGAPARAVLRRLQVEAEAMPSRGDAP
jgi:arylformamidase